MEMNAAYFQATLNALEAKGFVLEKHEDEHVENQKQVFHRTRVRCKRGEDCLISLEMLKYSENHQDFYLEILKMGCMRSFSFPLDSWKYHANRIEFKYRDDPETGLGLALTMDLA